MRSKRRVFFQLTVVAPSLIFGLSPLMYHGYSVPPGSWALRLPQGHKFIFVRIFFFLFRPPGALQFDTRRLARRRFKNVFSPKTATTGRGSSCLYLHATAAYPSTGVQISHKPCRDLGRRPAVAFLFIKRHGGFFFSQNSSVVAKYKCLGRERGEREGKKKPEKSASSFAYYIYTFFSEGRCFSFSFFFHARASGR